METFNLEPLLSDTSISVALYENVTNASKLKTLIKDGEIHAALIKAEMVLDVFQVLVASSKAFYAKTQNKLKTKLIYTEILFNLSPSNKISECFKLFGVEDEATCVLVVARKEDFSEVDKHVEGDICPLSKLDNLCDKQYLKKLYKVTDEELKVCSLTDCVVSQMAAKEIR
ncbi:unnamed protein product [Clavelina lepadiformis]|uniref:EKC/KEOPS complex subunit CGI121 n=1 Tax=Clavelina lepadiformis TaxID=159417 RepID=A0ABP0FCU4_CLALP